MTAPEPTWHFHNMVRRRTSSNQGEQPTKPPMPPPPLTTVGVNTKHYTRQEVDEQMNLLEQLMLQPGVTIAQQNAVMLQRLNVGGPRCNVLRERLRKVWVSQDDASRPADRAVAIRGIKRMLAHAEGQRTPDGQGWARHPNHTAVARYQHLLADLQGTRMPIEVRLHHEVSTAMADVIGNLTEEQVQEYFDRWQETCRKASEFDARQLAAAE